MPQILTTKAVIICPHLGVGTTAPTARLWNIQGGFACVDGDPGTLTCLWIPPCAAYTLRSMGLNATQINGRKVILATDFTQSITGLPLTITESNQVIDASTPAPLPAGSAPPLLAPFLLDLAKPIVTAQPMAAGFNTATQLPRFVAFTFTLDSAFPLQWILTRISNVPPVIGSHEDLTGGKPPGFVVGPAGGRWQDPSLTITLTMTALAMSGLGAGTHEFYMTGVSQRGRSAYAKSVLVVT